MLIGPICSIGPILWANRQGSLACPEGASAFTEGRSPRGTERSQLRSPKGAASTCQAYVPAGEDRYFKVGGVDRLARVVSPSRPAAHPAIVISFHGGGGSAYYAVDEYAIQKYWPEAIVYYAQGLPGKGGSSTWTSRDIAFFDALRSDALRRLNADPNLLFLHGYSTGANFAADLWDRRGGQITGLALISGGRYQKRWPAKPVFFSYGLSEPNAAALAVLARRFENSLRVVDVIRRQGGHTYPQDLNRTMVEFLKPPHR